tara:strand:+ start:3459 stop:4883 length:1425 start_codon:yes stop_codon:yes gene_type:complete
MSSTSTTWITDTNTKSGTVQIYESGVSTLRITAGEDTNAILELFADQGDDNADKWRMWTNSSDNDLHFTSYTSGSWVDKLTIRDDGNIGMGTSDASGKGLSLEMSDSSESVAISVKNAHVGTAADCRFVWYNDVGNVNAIFHGSNHSSRPGKFTFTDSGTTDFCFDISGKVGIGTISPDTLLDISSSSAPTIQISLAKDDIDDATDMGAIQWASMDADGASDTDVHAKIQVKAAQVHDGANFGSDMIFYTSDNTSSSLTAQMVILDDGNIGIGTLVPTAPLHIVHDTADGSPAIKIHDISISDTDYQTICFGRDPSDHEELQIRYTFSTGGSNQASYASFGLKGTETTLNINGYGRVGIGTTEPLCKLDVRGIMAIGSGTELTISSDAITVTQSYHNVDVEGGVAGSDTLTTINGGVTGAILVLRANNSARTISLTEGGNILLAGDFDLDNAADTITLIYDGSNWLEIARSNNA